MHAQSIDSGHGWRPRAYERLVDLARMQELQRQAVGDKEGLNRLYASLGFREVMRSMRWSRAIPTDDGASADGIAA